MELYNEMIQEINVLKEEVSEVKQVNNDLLDYIEKV